MKSRHVLRVALTAVMLLGAAGVAVAEEEPFPPTNMDIPFMDRQEIGARWTAMGGACLAFVDDGSAACWNPAGLGRIRRIELLASFANRRAEVESKWFGNSNTGSVGSTRLEDFALSYPFPTYRGALVFTGSVFRRISFDQYLDREGTRLVGDSPVLYHDVEDVKAVLTAWSGAFAIQLSERAFVGAEGHVFSGEYLERNTYYPWGDCSEPVTFAKDDDLSGFGGSLGAQYLIHPLASLGAVLRVPETIKLKGAVPQFVDDCEVEAGGQAEDEITLPYSIGVGIGVMPLDFTLACDVTYTDWNQLDYYGAVRDEATGDFFYDPTVDVRAGMEYTSSYLPVRLRAGYAHVPLALNLFDIKKNQRRLSLGAGLLAESVISIDFAWQRTTFERESKAAVDSYSEKRTIDKAVLTVGCRF